MKFYLSGGMEYKDGLGRGWREQITEELEALGHSTLDPVKAEDNDEEAASYDWVREKLRPVLENYRHMVRLKMFRKDIRDIQKADAIILLYDESVRRGAGTLAEAWEAFREGKPLYVVSSYERKDTPGWLIGESTELFEHLDEVVEYVKDHERVRIDKKLAEFYRDEYLKEIYKGR